MTAPTARKAAKKAPRLPKSQPATQGEASKPEAQAADTGIVKAKRAKPTPKAAQSASAGATANAAANEDTAKGKAKRAKKVKVVRDSFTMPETDYQRIASLKRKCLDAGVAVKKSELLRAGLQLLESVPSKRLLAAISALETVKTGRPAKSE